MKELEKYRKRFIILMPQGISQPLTKEARKTCPLRADYYKNPEVGNYAFSPVGDRLLSLAITSLFQYVTGSLPRSAIR